MLLLLTVVIYNHIVVCYDNCNYNCYYTKQLITTLIANAIVDNITILLRCIIVVFTTICLTKHSSNFPSNFRIFRQKIGIKKAKKFDKKMAKN